jgi:hypothetical protein
VTSTRIVLADYLGRPRILLTVRVPPACDVNGVFAAMHSLGRCTEFLHDGQAIRSAHSCLETTRTGTKLSQIRYELKNQLKPENPTYNCTT